MAKVRKSARRVLSAAAVLTAVGALVVAGIAQGSTTMGPTLEGVTPTFGHLANTQNVETKVEGGASAAAPVSGVLTKIRMARASTGSDPGLYAYRIFSGTSPNLTARPATPSGANDVYLAPPPSGSNGIDTYLPVDADGARVGIPIAQGEFLGVWIQKSGGWALVLSQTGSQFVRASGDTLGSQQSYSLFGDVSTLVAGVIEPDADGDKYGDESQDACPGDAARHQTPCAADVALTMTATPATVTAGDNVTYTITVTNTSGSPASSVSIADGLPGGSTLSSASSTQGVCGGTVTVTCGIGTLAAGGTAVATLIVRATSAGAQKNTATVASAGDANAANDSASVTTTVNPAPPPAPDVTPPSVTAASVTPKVVKPGGKATVTYALSEGAVVEIVIERGRSGRRVGKACRAPSHANAKRKKCTRWGRVARLLQGGAAGANSRSWPDVVKNGKPGIYRVTLRATDLAGLTGAAPRLTFRIARH